MFSDWRLDDFDLLFIENVANMVCPSGFDLGEDLRVMLVATTEGEDEPFKYPTLTLTADVAVISKIDLAEPVECDLDLLAANLEKVRPGIEILRTSAKRGDGIKQWIDLLRARIGVKARRKLTEMHELTSRFRFVARWRQNSMPTPNR